MRLLVDGQPLQSPDFRRRGVGRYVRNILAALVQLPGVQVETVFNGALPAPDDDDLRLTAASRTAAVTGAGAHWYEPPLPRTAATAGSDAFFADWLCALAPDVVLLSSPFDDAASIPRFGTGPRPLVAAIVYDLIPLLLHRRYLRASSRRELYGARLRQLDRCDLVLAISEATRRDVMRMLRWPAEGVTTILGAAEPAHEPPAGQDPQAMLRLLSIDQPFVLYVGGYDGRKNLTGALAAFAALPPAVRDGLQLVIVCALSPSQRRTLARVSRRLGIERGVVFTGYVDDDVLDVLYRMCRLFLFPSYYEGLGLPVLEALTRGAPVVVSDRSSIPEFAGPGAWLVDPASPAGMARAITEALARPYDQGADERRRFAAAFDWSTTARLALQAIERGVEARTRDARPPAVVRSVTADAGVRRRDVRPARHHRVAWVSPLPPARSGIADYSAELLVHLAGRFDLSLVVSPGATADSSFAGFPVLRPNQAIDEHQRRPFDLLVYHVGNHERHVYMLDLLRRYSGLTVLHDVAIGGLALKAQETGEWFGSIADTLQDEGSPLADAVRRGAPDHERIVREATLNGPVLARSEAVLVHSASSWRRVRQAAGVPVFRVPHGIPVPPRRSPAACRALLDLPASDFIIVTLGDVTASKCVDRIIEAVAALPPDLRTQTSLFVVGDALPPLSEALASEAGRLGIGSRVRFTGRVALEALGTFACAADVCVQLRHPVGGETSGALLRALAAGSACVVTDAGSFSELPDDVALRVAPEHGPRQLCEQLLRLHGNREAASRLREHAASWVERMHTMERAASLYADAISLTIARRQSHDSDWMDGAVYALNEAGGGEADAALFARWAEARRRALGVTGAR